MRNIGYKAYEKGLICRGKQYKEETVAKEKRAAICTEGIHYCLNPLDVFHYYPLISKYGDLTEFTMVTPLDKELKDPYEIYSTKRCCKKVLIGSKLSLESFIEESLDYIFKETGKHRDNHEEITIKGANSKVASSGSYTYIATFGNDSQVASIGYGNNLTTIGCQTRIAAIGNNDKITSNGRYSYIVSSGNYTDIATIGDGSQVVSTGYGNNIVTAGDYSIVFVSGGKSRAVSVGDQSKLIVNYGNNIGVNIGRRARIKGSIGSWITLAEYSNYNDDCICIKSARIDGKVLKENVWYELLNGEFVECQ